MKDIPGWEGLYAITREGKIWSHRKKTWKATNLNATGYCQISLWRDAVALNHGVHRLVAITFIPNPLGKRTVNHKNGNKLDNSVENLEWATYGENERHARLTGLKKMSGTDNWRALLDEEKVRKIRRNYQTGNGASLARLYGVKKEAIYAVVHGRTWRHIV